MKEAYAKYTAAINLNCNDNTLNSKIHCNRAAINLKLKNYGKVVEDCKKSLSYDPKYAKAYYRLAKAYIGLRKYSECIELLNDQT
jgi:small subunit ribosomal protein S7e